MGDFVASHVRVYIRNIFDPHESKFLELEVRGVKRAVPARPI